MFPISGTGVGRFSIQATNLTLLKLFSTERRDLYGYGRKSGRVCFCSKYPGGLGFEEDFGVKEQVLSDLRIQRSQDESGWEENDDGFKEVSDAINELASASVEFLEQNGDGLKVKMGRRRVKGDEKKMDMDFKFEGKEGTLRSGRNVLKRSSLVAKQVISIQSAISLGFVCQLWVDANTWRVQLVEVRASLLSSESERFLLKDVFRVGDVVLVRDESVMDTETQLIGLETLVGYEVITAGRRKVGKVRGYSFDINSRAVESLELDSFGISIIPSSLVSTYVLLVEDVLQVLPDAIVVHEAAASRIQRLTKGLWGTKSATSNKKYGEFNDVDIEGDQSSLPIERPRLRRKSSKQKYDRDTSDNEDEWELPIDYL